MSIEFNNNEEIQSNVILGIFGKNNDSFELPEGPVIDKGAFSLRPLLISEQNSEEDLYSFYVIGQEIMNRLEMNEKEILELAKQNSMEKFPGEMKAISDFISVTDQVMIPDGVVVPQIYVLTNEHNICGAAAMFYQPELLDNLSRLTGKDLAIFPVDINCVYCVPVSTGEQIEEFREMYKMAVDGMSHVLSEDVLHYDMVNKQLKDLSGNIIETIQQQQQMMHRIHSGR